MLFSANQSLTLNGLLDRLIPKDEEPSATEAGVGGFIAELLSNDAKEQAQQVLAGLDALDAEAKAGFQSPFSALQASDQDALLEAFDGNLSRLWRSFAPGVITAGMADEGL